VRFLSLFKKSMAENFRDWKILILGITFAPFFVVLMFLYLDSSPQTFHLIILNHDKGVITSAGKRINYGNDLVETLTSLPSPDSSVVLKVKQERDLISSKKLLKDHAADLVVEIPDNFSRALNEFRSGNISAPVKVKTYGDPSNIKYIMAATWGHAITYHFTTEITGIKSPIELEDITITPTKTLSDFDLYMPALMALALMMLMFTGAGSIIKEKDKGTIVRLRISNMRAAEWFAASSLTQVIIGLLAMGLTYLTAYSLGYRTEGSWLTMIVVGVISSLSIMAISLVVAAFLRTIFDLVTI
jgi:ABC-2 type transport system permease protein